jgi:protein MpaA
LSYYIFRWSKSWHVEQRVELLSGETVYYAFVILEIIAVDGLRRWNLGQSDTSKHQVLPVACSNRATATPGRVLSCESVYSPHMSFDFQGRRVHDYNFLIKRWISLAREIGLNAQVYATAEAFDLLCFSSPALEQKGGVYLSAGVHGDEAAATEGLYEWVELRASILPRLPVMIFPCLNPWGLLSNRRADSENRDLNRCYHLNELPRIRAQKDLIQGHSFRLAMCLHEDYDARGVYVYEACNRLPRFSRELLASAANYVPTDKRRMLEARGFDALRTIARRINFTKFPFLTEGMYLALHHSERTITTETPSEYDLDQRIQAQIAMVQRAIELSTSRCS